jgi:hypothetical protein
MYDGDWLPVDERLNRLIEPEVILPSQFLAGRSRDLRYPGERRLVAAMLEDAVRIYQREAGSRNRRRQRLFWETERWIESSGSDTSWPFAFERVCEVLRLDPDYLRRGLRAWKKRAVRGPQAPVNPLRSVARSVEEVERPRASGE